MFEIHLDVSNKQIAHLVEQLQQAIACGCGGLYECSLPLQELSSVLSVQLFFLGLFGIQAFKEPPVGHHKSSLRPLGFSLAADVVVVDGEPNGLYLDEDVFDEAMRDVANVGAVKRLEEVR